VIGLAPKINSSSCVLILEDLAPAEMLQGFDFTDGNYLMYVVGKKC